MQSDWKQLLDFGLSVVEDIGWSYQESDCVFVMRNFYFVFIYKGECYNQKN